MACTTNYDYDCNHCDASKKNFGASIKEFIGKNPCWGHTGYMIFQLGQGIYKFSKLTIWYRTTEICSYSNEGSECSPADCYAGTDYYTKEKLPPSWPAEGGMWCSKDGCPPQGTNGTDTPWYIYAEISKDGVTWQKIAKLPFDWIKTTDQADITLPSPVEARFIRVRQPDDEGQKTLAGYLDHVSINIKDLQLVVPDTGPYTAATNNILNASNSIDAITPYAGGNKKFWGAKTTVAIRTQDEKICGNMGTNPYTKYTWASGNHAATWFAGAGKEWQNITKITGQITLASFRGAKSADLIIQFSNDGIKWASANPITANVDATNQINIILQTPINARFIRIFPKPLPWGWTNGSIPPAWITDANLTLTTGGGPTGKASSKITNIAWFPDYPDRKVPPNTKITIANLTIKNVGDADGTIYVNAYQYTGTNWQKNASNTYSLAAGASKSLTLTGITPSSGKLHIAITTYAEGETEPALPNGECP